MAFDFVNVAMGQQTPIRHLTTDLEWQATDAEIWIGVRQYHCNIRLRIHFFDSQSSADAGIAAADDEHFPHLLSFFFFPALCIGL